MYSSLPSFVLGFHGCDKSLAESIFAGKKHLQKSTNKYDWLGNGIYFWENNPQRALEYAKELKDNPQRCSEKIITPAIIGAIIDLGHCLNLLDSKSIKMVKEANSLYEYSCCEAGYPIAENKPAKKSKDLLLRFRDCAVLEFLHATREKNEHQPFSSVRGMFAEGTPLYENAGFHEKSHIQLCIRNPNCIKGYFRVVDSFSDWPLP